MPLDRPRDDRMRAPRARGGVRTLIPLIYSLLWEIGFGLCCFFTADAVAAACSASEGCGGDDCCIEDDVVDAATRPMHPAVARTVRSTSRRRMMERVVGKLG